MNQPLCLTFGALFLVGVAVAALPSQTTSTLIFDAASLKETPPADGQVGTFFTYAGGRMYLRGCTLQLLIFEAYKVQPFQILNAPAWVQETRYSIDAVPPPIPKLADYHPSNPKLIPPDEELTMLQALLADRFQLKVHEEMKDGPGYAIIRGDRPLRLNEPADKTERPVVTLVNAGTSFYRQGINSSMADLASFIARDLKEPVLDQSGIAGSYDFKFDWVPDPSDTTPGGYLFAAIQQIGLQLKAIKVPVQYIVIDHVEKPRLD
ncbi:MAG TPA: TIGR03435 family protein [Terriglobia bacterium]|jgi:uncharacterized protein (TIGR03435 family)